MSGRSKKLWIPAGAAQVAGIALTQCAAVATIPGLLFKPAATVCGCQPLMRAITAPPVDSITVGYQAAQTGGYSPPTNLLINGQAVTIDQTPITSSPTTPPPTTPPEIPTGGTVIST